MSGIKYYKLAKDEELPDEFCAVRDIDGEPSEYTFYVLEAENAKLKAENAKLKETFLMHTCYYYDEQHNRCNCYVNENLNELLDKNTKLQELAQDVIAFLDDIDPCRHCGYDAECFKQNGLNVAYEGGCLMLGLLVSRARKLGVEVD